MSYHRFSNRITDLLTADLSNIHTTIDLLFSVIKHIVYALSSRRLIARNVHVILVLVGEGRLCGRQGGLSFLCVRASVRACMRACACVRACVRA